jgi:dUTP pyrophosphatase
MNILIEKIFPDAKLPMRSYATDSGLDLFVYKFERLFNYVSRNETTIFDNDFIDMFPGDRLLVNTGLKATVGEGYEIQIRSRSGLALKNGLFVLNSPGTVDEQYRGMIGVILANISNEVQVITKGDKIAQMVACPVCLFNVVEVTKLPESTRGENGFGSTGKK